MIDRRKRLPSYLYPGVPTLSAVKARAPALLPFLSCRGVILATLFQPRPYPRLKSLRHGRFPVNRSQNSTRTPSRSISVTPSPKGKRGVPQPTPPWMPCSNLDVQICRALAQTTSLAAAASPPASPSQVKRRSSTHNPIPSMFPRMCSSRARSRSIPRKSACVAIVRTSGRATSS